MLLQYLFCTISISDYRLFLRKRRSEIPCEKITMDTYYSLFDFRSWYCRFRFTWHERYQSCWSVLNCNVCCDIPCGDLLLHLEHCERHKSVFRIRVRKNGSVIEQNRFFVCPFKRVIGYQSLFLLLLYFVLSYLPRVFG